MSEARARRGPTWRVVRAVLSIAIVLAIFGFAIPRIADYAAVWSTITGLTALELGSIVLATLFNLLTYWLQNMAALPGLGLAQAAVLTQTTTSVANTIPGGGAVAVGLTYSILRSWGFDGSAIGLYVGVTGVWNIFLKLGLPIVSLAVLVVQGRSNVALLTAAVIGVIVLAVAVGAFALVLWKKAFARMIGDGLGRALAPIMRLARRAAVDDMGERAVRFRRDTISLVARRWIPLTLTTILSHLALWFVLLLAVRHVGIAEGEVGTAQVLAVFAFGRLIGALPLTPGGIGVVELGYIGGLVAAGGPRPEVVAAVLLFRTLTYGIQIPLGGATYMVWRARSGWMKQEPERDGVAAAT